MATNPLFNTGTFGGAAAVAGQITVAYIIYAAYRISGVLKRPGRGYSESEANDGLQVLNDMLDQWKAERLMIYAILRNEFNVVSGQEYYSIGESTPVDWNIQRPEKIEAAEFLFNNVTPAVGLLMTILTPQDWEALSPKKLQANTPTLLYYEPLVPNGRIYLWPIATTNWKVALYTWQNVAEFGSTGDAVVVPPAYRSAIEYNLARELAMRFPEQAQMSQDAIQKAISTKEAIKVINTPLLKMQTERADLEYGNPQSRYNPYTNQYQ